MGKYRQTARDLQPWRIFLALVCVLLVVVGGTVQVAHTHADGTASHADCSLCAAAHASVHVAEVPVPVTTAAMLGPVEVAPPGVTTTAVSTFALFTRPPPAPISAD